MISGNEKLEVLDWGLQEYIPALSRQKALVEERLTGRVTDRLVLVEHPPVVTIGRSGAATDLLLSEEGFLEKGVKISCSERGGKATYHGPGQLVAYPILELQEKDLHLYVQRLLETVAAVLGEYGLEAQFKVGEPGLWVNENKIASLGVAAKKWVTYHGVALNVNTDLTPFSWILPCGKRGETITSMEKELGHSVDFAQVKERFITKFREFFGYPESRKGKRHPSWLKLPAPKAAAVEQMEGMLDSQNLRTVCQDAHCPNLGECFGRGTATFMILGSECTRLCRFCAVEKGSPLPPDPHEPERVAQAAKQLGLKYVVVTSVTRDDLPDGGAGHFARTIESIRKEVPETAIEVLVPDFQGSRKALEVVFQARPEMFNHNIETVSRLYPSVRPQAGYARSLDVLAKASASGLPVKSGLMLGLGERPDEVTETLSEMRAAGCSYLTLGQYLAPSEQHAPVVRYLSPDEFSAWAEIAREMGFKEVAAGPLVRSSYRADEMVLAETCAKTGTEC